MQSALAQVNTCGRVSGTHKAELIRQVDRGNSRKVRLRRVDVEKRFPALLALLAAERA